MPPTHLALLNNLGGPDILIIALVALLIFGKRTPGSRQKPRPLHRRIQKRPPAPRPQSHRPPPTRQRPRGHDPTGPARAHSRPACRLLLQQETVAPAEPITPPPRRNLRARRARSLA